LVTQGSYRNILKYLYDVSYSKILAGHPQLKPISLSGTTVFAQKPPILFFGGTQDFILSDAEVINLRKYLSYGGTVWGESSQSVGGITPFDKAFQREMRRVVQSLGGISDFAPLYTADPVFVRDPYFTEIKKLPSGVNGSQGEVLVMRYYDEISVIHSTRGYFQLMLYGLARSGSDWSIVTPPDWTGAPLPDMPRRDELVSIYKFTSNMILYLVTRWEYRRRGMSEL